MDTRKNNILPLAVLITMVLMLGAAFRQARVRNSQSQNAAGLQAAQQRRETEQIESLRKPLTAETPMPYDRGVVIESSETQFPGIYKTIWKRTDGIIFRDISSQNLSQGTPIMLVPIKYNRTSFHDNDGSALILQPLDPRSEEYRKLTAPKEDKQ